MFNKTQFFKRNTPEAIDGCAKAINKIRSLKIATENSGLDDYFKALARNIVICSVEADDAAAFNDATREFYNEIRPENYGSSFANPEHAVNIFGEPDGRLLSAIFSEFRSLKDLFRNGMHYHAADYCDLFFTLYESALKNGTSGLAKIYTAFKMDSDPHAAADRMSARFDPAFPVYKGIIMDSDLSTPDYLDKYGVNISENEIEISRHFASMTQKEVDALALNIAEGYIRGFTNSNKKLDGKSTVMVIYNAGQERLIRTLSDMLKQRGLDALPGKPDATPVNRQYQYDHKFDIGLYLTEDYLESAKKTDSLAFEANSALLDKYSGVIFIDKFGEKPFSPAIKKANISLAEEQRPLYMKRTSDGMMLRNKYMPREKTSFCIIAFPTPEIGADFKAIFDETVKINSLDNALYEKIQQNIIDVLDKAEYVHVKGSGDNRTDIKVSMQPLKDPAAETNFVNCTADVNIPVGEVFTSPQLKGTSGTLHLKETFLDDLKYVDLELTFKDGYVSDYTCANFKDEKENKKYIRENLLAQRDTLPIGEFAIGTNTLAYQASRRFNMLDVLPILIIEKMGPHFAIGDTCFSHEEEHVTYNPDGKQITAVENELSALRDSDPAGAYTNCHTDITLPYESLAYIKAVTSGGEELYVIKDGRFAVKGTEELNKYLD